MLQLGKGVLPHLVGDRGPTTHMRKGNSQVPAVALKFTQERQGDRKGQERHARSHEVACDMSCGRVELTTMRIRDSHERRRVTSGKQGSQGRV